MKKEPDDKVSGERQGLFQALKHMMGSKGLSFAKRKEEGRFELEVWRGEEVSGGIKGVRLWARRN